MNTDTEHLNEVPAPRPGSYDKQPEHRYENESAYNQGPAQHESQDQYGYRTESHNDGPNYGVPENRYPTEDYPSRTPPRDAYPSNTPPRNDYPPQTPPRDNYPNSQYTPQGGNSMSGGSAGPSTGGSAGPSTGPSAKEQRQRERIENYHSDCSMLETEDDCMNVGEDCFWYTEFQKCHPMEGACYTYISETLCAYNEDCSWNPLDGECQSPCSILARKADCIEEEEECFWQNRPAPGEEESCQPTNLPCSELSSQFQCGLNIEACIWEEQGDGCISVYSTCDKYKTEETCGMSTVFTCEWDEDLLVCGVEKVLLQQSNVEETAKQVKGTINEGKSDVIDVNYIVLVVCTILILIGGICSILHCLKLHKKIGGDLYFLNNNLDVYRE